MKNIIVLLAVLAFAGVAFAGSGGITSQPTIGGLGFPFETAVNIATDKSFVGTVIFWESDDSAVYTGPTGAVIDTGTEACAVYAMACADAWTFDAAGASGDEIVDSTCATDIADNGLALAVCY